MRLSVSIPCWGRPERTKRSIEAILSQDTHGWEALIVGDCCPHFQKLISSGFLAEAAWKARQNGNYLIYENLPKHSGHCGYAITNLNIERARGKYLIFYANDDIILPNHFRNYLEIENTELDYMYFNSYLAPTKLPRISKLAPACIGHSEIIVKTDLARKCRAHIPRYGHDWEFIYDIARFGQGQKSKSKQTTYHVMHVANHDDVDTID